MATIKRGEPRLVKITPNVNPYAFGSVIVEFGNTKVHITASVKEDIPPFLKGKGEGWVTAEYSMLPGSTHTRSDRERKGPSGRTHEIQRLIGRSLRTVIDMKKLGERTITIDCDVLVADGGTRTASITGAYVALSLAVKKLQQAGLLKESPIKMAVAALSVGINKNGEIIADLNYEEDSSCHTDMNIVMTADGRFIEIQGTAEREPFSKDELDSLMKCATDALKVIFSEQERVLR